MQYLESDLIRGQNSNKWRSDRIIGCKIVSCPVWCLAIEKFWRRALGIRDSTCEKSLLYRVCKSAWQCLCM